MVVSVIVIVIVSYYLAGASRIFALQVWQSFRLELSLIGFLCYVWLSGRVLGAGLFVVDGMESFISHQSRA